MKQTYKLNKVHTLTSLITADSSCKLNAQHYYLTIAGQPNS